MAALLPATAHGAGGGAVPNDNGPVTVVAIEAQPVAVAPQTQPPSPPQNGSRNSTYISLRGGVGIPLDGPLARLPGGPGGSIEGVFGGRSRVGLDVAGMGDLRFHFPSGGSYVSFLIGATVRYTFLEQFIIHPFAEIRGGIGLAWMDPHVHGASPSSELALGFGAGLGVQLDLTEHWSIEVAARVDGLFDQGMWRHMLLFCPDVISPSEVCNRYGSVRPADGAVQLEALLTPYVALTYYGSSNRR